MKRYIYTSEITAPKHIHFPYRGLSIDLEGFTGEIESISGYCPKAEETIDITKEIVGENFAFYDGALGIVEAVEVIDDWLDHHVRGNRRQHHLDNPVF